MRKIAADKAQVGDVLAEPLANAQGRVLLPKGARLSAAVLSRLNGWGISVLTVEGEDEDTAGTEKLLEDLEFRFADLEDDSLMMQIKEIARTHLMKK